MQLLPVPADAQMRRFPYRIDWPALLFFNVIFLFAVGYKALIDWMVERVGG